MTNALERANKEFKHRTKPMQVLANEHSAYTVLNFIAFKMEHSRRSRSLEAKNLSVFQHLPSP